MKSWQSQWDLDFQTQLFYPPWLSNWLHLPKCHSLCHWIMGTVVCMIPFLAESIHLESDLVQNWALSRSAAKVGANWPWTVNSILISVSCWRKRSVSDKKKWWHICRCQRNDEKYRMEQSTLPKHAICFWAELKLKWGILPFFLWHCPSLPPFLFVKKTCLLVDWGFIALVALSLTESTVEICPN